MSLFKSTDNKTEIFICIWEWCPTWCQSCYKTIKENKEYKLEKLKQQIDISNEISDENFSYFLYWTNNIQNPEIIRIISYIKSLSRNLRIQLPFETTKLDLKNLLKENFNNEYVISRKIDNKDLLKIFIKSLWEFHNNQIIINYDLLIKEDYISLLERILKKKFNVNNDWPLYLKLWNLNINLRVLYSINYKEKKVQDLWINSCFVYDSFNINNDYIEVVDHYEVDENLDVCFHNPLCYIWNNKIANLKHTNKEIISNFLEYKNHYLKNLNSDFEKNCFKCITSGFRYKD